jgi:predicted Zn-dependent peptidase
MIKILESKNDKSFEKGPVRRSLFSNGAVSLFHQFKGMESATVNLYFLSGSIFEKENEYGIAHVIEHMLFKENKTGELVRTLEAYGASMNAYTYKEYVCFELDCSAKKIHLFLPKFLNLFFNPVFDTKALAKEKKVILQELRQDKDDHEVTGVEYIYEKNFDSKLGHPIGGTTKNIRSFTSNDLQRYYKKYFCPSRMVLNVVSGRSFDSLEDIFKNSLKNFPSKNTAPWRYKPVRKNAKLNHFKSALKRKIQASIVYLVFDGVTLGHDDYYIYSIIDELLFEGMTSRFYRALREKTPLVYSFGSDLNSFATSGSYTMIFNTSKSNVSTLKKVVLDEIKALRDSISDAELIALKERLIEGWSLSFDSLHERGEFIAHGEVYQEQDFSLKKQIEILKSINSKDIRRILDKMISQKHSELILGV